MFLLWRLNGRLPTKAELGVAVTSIEYFGGLIDFTGEMGRFAVARATARDEVAVRTCLETDVYVSRSIHHNWPLEAGCLVCGGVVLVDLRV
jgi:predicted translin family RNA/ssDNA-binding protein